MLALVRPCAGLLKDHPCAASGSFLGGGSVKKKGWSALLLAPNKVTAPEAGDSHTGADCTHVADSWNRAHSDTMQRARQGDLHRAPQQWWIAVSEYTATR